MAEERDEFLEKEFDFTKAVKNPYASRLKKTITINIEEETIKYFKRLAERYGIPYQTLINLYLKDCAENNKQPQVIWQ